MVCALIIDDIRQQEALRNRIRLGRTPVVLPGLEKPAGEARAAFLDGACGDDSDLRRRLEALLQKFETLGTFLEKSAVSAPDSLHRLIAGGASPTETVAAKTLTEKAGDRIDRYKLLQQIGEGGCGVVFPQSLSATGTQE